MSKVLVFRKVLFVLLILIFLGSLVFVIFQNFFVDEPISSERSGGSGSGGSAPRYVCPPDSFVIPDFSGLKGLLESQPLISDLPKKGSVRLRFYHFAGRCRVWDKSYFITKGSVVESGSKGEIDLWVHSKYVPELSSDNLCEVVGVAEGNGDLGRDTALGPVKLGLRYGKLFGYKSCLGL